MSTGSGERPDGGTPTGRPAADTPQRLVVRSLDPESDSTILGANDTAVAAASAVPPVSSDGKTSLTQASSERSAPVAGQVTELIGVTLSGRYLVTRKVGQ